MAVNENIIAAWLDGNITKAQAAEALGGLTADDSMLFEEAALDNNTITDIYDGLIPPSLDDEVTPMAEFQLADLPIIAQEISEGDDFIEMETYDDIDFIDTDNLPVTDDPDVSTFAYADPHIDYPCHTTLPDLDIPTDIS